jgi:hypothetical protein
MNKITPEKFDRQGLTLVQIFAQPEPLSSLNPAKHPNARDRKRSR